EVRANGCRSEFTGKMPGIKRGSCLGWTLGSERSSFSELPHQLPKTLARQPHHLK
ncbi:MAG: hypothetical protein ACI89J_000988, partial [Hyphomicrobiaceae bacterium]